MLLCTPNYYKDFTCIASRCRDNCCCGGWQIGIDEETVQKYRSLDTDFGRALMEAIDYTDEYCFKPVKHQCPFLDEKHLCRIYQELGPDYMGVVCDQFPRYSEYYGNRKETGLGIACEEAARILLQAESFSLTESEIHEEAYEDSEFDARLCEHLIAVRSFIFQWIDITDSLKELLCGILLISSDLQAFINDNDEAGLLDYLNTLHVDSLRHRLQNLGAEFFSKEDYSIADIESDMATLWLAYQDLYILSEDWAKLLSEVLESLHPAEPSDRSIETYQALLKNRSFPISEIKNLLRYYVFRYYLKASYHHNVLGTAQFIVSHFCIYQDLVAYKGIEASHDLLHLLSREIEYSPDNVDTLFENYLFDELYQPDCLCRFLWYYY